MTTTATTKLADLEAAAFAGESVTPKQFADARAAVELEQIVTAGAAHRDAQAADVAEAEKRSAAKAAAADILAGHSDDAIIATYAALAHAFDNLVAVIDANDDAVKQAARVLDRAGVPSPNPYAGMDGETHPDNLDPDNHPEIFRGRVGGVVLGGVAYSVHSGETGILIGHATQDAAQRHGGLPLPGGSKSIERRLDLGSFSSPLLDAARDHLAAHTA